MGALDDLAARNTTRLELTASMASVGTSTYTATATSDSSNGAVDVVLSDTVTGDGIDDSVSVELPTTVSVRKGDTVLVTGYGGEVLKSAVVTGDLGGGDRIRDEVDNIVSATSQYFWTVDGEDGAHVTNVPQEQFLEDPSGANLLANSNGILLRDGETYLSAFTTDGMTVYDGNGNDAGNTVAEFVANGARIGYQDSAHVSITDSSLTFSDENGNVAGVMDSSGGSITEFITKVAKLNPAGHDVAMTLSGVPDMTAGTPIITLTFVYGQQRSFPITQLGVSGNYSYIEQSASYVGTYSTTETADGWTLTVNDTSTYKVTGVQVRWYTTRQEPIFDWHGHVEQSIKTGTVNLSNIGSGTKALNLWREGHVVHASMIATATASAANSAITCGTIPEGFRPIANEFQSGACVSNNTLNGYFRWRVATTGVVTYWCSVTAIRESPLCMTWLTNDAW